MCQNPNCEACLAARTQQAKEAADFQTNYLLAQGRVKTACITARPLSEAELNHLDDLLGFTWGRLNEWFEYSTGQEKEIKRLEEALAKALT